MDKDAIIISHRFSLVEYEIERLKAKIHMQREAWFFKKHFFSIEDLLHSEHYAKIYAIAEKTGDEVFNWYIRGKLSEDGWDTYRKERESFRRKMNVLNREIEERVPTVWENLMSIFEDFLVITLKVLPTLAKLLKAGAAYLGLDASKLLTSSLKKMKLLPKPKDHGEA